MNKVKWLFEKDTHDDNLNALMVATEALGHKARLYDFRPFADKSELQSLYKPEECVVVYGSIQLCSAINRFCSWVPGTYCSFPAYDCTSYYPFLANYLLNSDYVMLPYGELLRRRDFLYSTLGSDNAVFIRPDTGRKTFTGKVVYKENFEREVDKFGFYDTMIDDLVIVAPPHNIIKEWRLLVVNQFVEASSQYLPDRKRECPQEVIDLGNEIAKLYEPDKCWTIDICQLKDGTLKLLEIGSFSCAGTYCCDPYKIIQAVSAQALKDWQELRNG
jgi:hypothetical protein